MRLLKLSLLSLGACIVDPADPVTRTVVLAIHGEHFVEDGLHPHEFEDEWTLDFTSFLVSIGDITLAEEPLDEASPQFRIVDLARARDEPGLELGVVTASTEHPNSRIRPLRYVIAPSADPVAGNVDETDVARMRDGGYSIRVEGTATRGEDTRRFAWGFSTRTVYTDCVPEASFADEEPRVELTLRGDHLFHDGDHLFQVVNLVFDPVADADVNTDGEITEDELRAADITHGDIDQVGDLIDVTDLWSFLERQTGLLGHVDGWHDCRAVPQ